MVEFHTLGTVSLDASEPGRDCASVLAQPKRTALLAYLALARPRGLHSRDAVLSLFWPESSERQARKSLNQALYFLRRRLGRNVVISEGGRVGAGSGLWCDALEFDRRLEQGEPKEALELYRGEFLPAFFPADSPALERWLDGERSRFLSRARAAAVALADGCAGRSDGLEEVYWLRRARELDPYDELLAERLVERLSDLGDRTGALRELDEFERRLQSDLGIGPSPRLLAEARALVEASEEARGDAVVIPDAAPTATPGPASGSLIATTPETPLTPEAVESSEAPGAPGASRPRRFLRSRATVRIAAGLFIGIVLGFAGAPLLRSDGGAAYAPLDSKRLLVADLANATGDPDNAWLGGVAAHWIAQELEASGLLDPIPASAVAGELRARGPGEGATDRATLDLAARVGAGLAVTGSYYALRDSLEFHARVLDVATGQLVRSIEGSPTPTSAPLPGIDRLRRAVTAALATTVDPRLSASAAASSQPPDLEAYRLYADGLDAFFHGDWRTALDLLRSAGARDSSFTAPLIWAAHVGMQSARPRVADSVLAALAPRRNSLRAWDRAMMDFFEARLRGTWEDVRVAASRVVDIAPGSEWLLQLAAANLDVNRPAETLRIHDMIDPTLGWLREWPYHWKLRADAQHRLGRYEEQLEDVAVWREALPGAALSAEIGALAGLGRLELLAARLESGMRGLDVWSRAGLLVSAASELDAHGQPAEAEELRERAFHTLGTLAPEELKARPGVHARILLGTGRWTEARAAYLSTTSELGVSEETRQSRLGQIAARLGEREEALRRSAWLAGRGEGPSTRGWYSMERAFIHALLGERETAFQLIERAIAEGHGFYPWLHVAPPFESMRGWGPFDELMRPKG
ncbi:MAG: BTAD domain-containing putative transcriptional regulator [Gemmatimonadota bacterium]|nr:BTAD domain-containing putative transcriptional regulator [Gemmatimonadota bacterium]